MQNFLRDKWNAILVLEIIALVVLVVTIVARPKPPCTLSFEVHQGQNFNQPYPTYRNCGAGSNYPVLVK